MRTQIELTSLVISSSGTNSTAVDKDVLSRQGGIGVCIQAPATLTGASLTVEISLDGGSNYAALQSPPGTDVTVAAGKAIVVAFNAWDKLRVTSDQSEGAERTIPIRGVRQY